MAATTPKEPLAPTARLSDRALADIRYIRETMAAASGYTTFSGLGLVLVGLGALVTGAVAARFPTPMQQARLWLVNAALSVPVGILFGWAKARSRAQPVLTGPVRKFTLSFAPAIVAGLLLTLALWRDGQVAHLQAIWLLLYGAAVTAAGTASVKTIPVLGVLFMTLGAIALFGPASLDNALMTAGFGGLHVAFGALIARRHGG